MKNIILRTLARWRASRAATRSITIRRDLRDHTRNELHRATIEANRARGLRIYAAWLAPTRRTKPSPAGFSALFPGTTTRLAPVRLISLPRPVRKEVAA
jgi:hypothetical protein